MISFFTRTFSFALVITFVNVGICNAQIQLKIKPLELGIKESNITSLSFVKDTDELIYTTSSGDINILNITTKSKSSWQAGFAIDQLEISENGNFIAVSGKKNIAVFETSTHKVIMKREDLDGPRIFHFNPATSNLLIYTVDPKKLMHHNLITGDRMQIKTVHGLVHMIYHTSGEFLVVGTKKETYSVNLKTGNTKAFYKQNQKGESNLERLGIWDDHTRPLAFIDSGRFLVTRPYGSFESHLTIFESISGELEANIDVNYQYDITTNLNPLCFSDAKATLLVPTFTGDDDKQDDVTIKLFFDNKYSSKADLITYSFKKKPKGGARVYYDLNSSGVYAATFCANSATPTLELYKLEWQ